MVGMPLLESVGRVREQLAEMCRVLLQREAGVPLGKEVEPRGGQEIVHQVLQLPDVILDPGEVPGQGFL